MASQQGRSEHLDNEEESLLGAKDQIDTLRIPGGRRPSHYVSPKSRTAKLLLALTQCVICLALLGTGFAFGATVASNRPPLASKTAIHPIPGLNVKYGEQTYTDFEESIYAGAPSPGVDAAWHGLLGNMALRVSDEELALSNQSSVSLPDGGNMAWLGVFHELHCIKMLRQWNYREHYHPGLRPEDRPHLDIHADHCLDILRSAAMCRADTTLTTFGWKEEQARPMLNTRLIPRRCVSWDLLMDSVRSRAVSSEEVNRMVNPLLL